MMLAYYDRCQPVITTIQIPADTCFPPLRYHNPDVEPECAVFDASFEDVERSLEEWKWMINDEIQHIQSFRLQTFASLSDLDLM